MHYYVGIVYHIGIIPVKLPSSSLGSTPVICWTREEDITINTIYKNTLTVHLITNVILYSGSYFILNLIYLYYLLIEPYYNSLNYVLQQSMLQ